MYEALTTAGDSLFKSQHSAEWWVAGLTGVLAIAAVVAGVFAFRQLRETERARQAQLLPVVQFRRAALLPANDTHKFVELTLANIGAGPAIDVECTAWMIPVSSDVAKDAKERDGLIAGLQSHIDVNPPAGRASVQGLGSGQSLAIYVLRDGDSLVSCGEDLALVAVTMVFKDAFGTKFRSPEPSAPGRTKSTYRFAPLEDRPPLLG